MPIVSPHFYRAHGLGNDYLVFEAAGEPRNAPDARAIQDGWPLTEHAIRAICERGTGEGSDGIVILLDRAPAGDGAFPLRMFNPDGSEFERSGNGLRVLGSWLRVEGLVGDARFRVRSGGVEIGMRVHHVSDTGSHDISVAMGRALAGADAIGPIGWRGEAIESGAVPAPADRFELRHPELGPLALTPVWVGNPHAVIFREDAAPEELDGELLRRIGPFVATHPAFAAGTNVQLARVTAEGVVHIGIWERGVGRTPASGTSSCAAAVAAVRSGRRAPGWVPVRMAGGELGVRVGEDLDVELRGPVQEVCRGELTQGFLRFLKSGG